MLQIVIKLIEKITKLIFVHVVFSCIKKSFGAFKIALIKCYARTGIYANLAVP